jgi:IS5 family transposase
MVRWALVFFIEDYDAGVTVVNLTAKFFGKILRRAKKLITLFVSIDDLSKGKKITARAGRGRPCRLYPREIMTIYVWFLRSKCGSFKEFYNGVQGKFLRPFSPKMTTYGSFMRQLKLHFKKFWILRSRSHQVFASMARWAYSSTGAKFGLKMHVVVGGDQKIRNFVLKPGNLHDVSCAEEVLKNFQGTVIGDKGYCSAPLANQLKRRGIRLIARHRSNMRPNTPEEKKLLRKRSIGETVPWNLHWQSFLRGTTLIGNFYESWVRDSRSLRHYPGAGLGFSADLPRWIRIRSSTPLMIRLDSGPA